MIAKPEGWEYRADRALTHPDLGMVVPTELHGTSWRTVYISPDGATYGPFASYGDATWFASITDGGSRPFPEMAPEDREAAKIWGKRWLMAEPPTSGNCSFCGSPISGEWIYRPGNGFAIRVQCVRCFMIARIKGKVTYANRRVPA